MDGSSPQTSPQKDFIRSRGIKMPKNADVIRPRTRKALRQNSYEGFEADAVMKIAREGDRVIELGGGIGYISTLIGARKPVEQIHTFEANPMLIDYIRSAHALNGVENAQVHNTLLTPNGGPPRNFYVRKNFLSSSLDRDTGPEEGILSVEKIPTRAINTVFNEIKPTVLICDIEGGEAELLPALTYDGLRVAVLELHPQWTGAPGVQAVFNAMHKAGLTYFPRWSHRKVVVFRREW